MIIDNIDNCIINWNYNGNEIIGRVNNEYHKRNFKVLPPSFSPTFIFQGTEDYVMIVIVL